MVEEGASGIKVIETFHSEPQISISWWHNRKGGQKSHKKVSSGEHEYLYKNTNPSCTCIDILVYKSFLNFYLLVAQNKRKYQSHQDSFSVHNGHLYKIPQQLFKKLLRYFSLDQTDQLTFPSRHTTRLAQKDDEKEPVAAYI